MENLVYKLESEIHNYILDNNLDVTLIIMHPKTWEDLRKESFMCDFSFMNRHSIVLKYRGIKVIRSYDIRQEVFELKHK
jgi:hypothetical protein